MDLCPLATGILVLAWIVLVAGGVLIGRYIRFGGR